MNNKGLFYGIAAYSAWALLPIYWRTIEVISALEILGQRIVWSFLFLLLLLAFRRQWAWIRIARRNGRTLLIYLTSALLLTINWGVYIWGVNAGFIVETSLGYFINPLINVLLGVVFLGERLRRWQLVAVGSATFGVLYLTFSYGALPWIALILALSFGFYGLLRKKAPLASIEGLSLETGLMAVPALLFLGFLQSSGMAVFPNVSPLVLFLVPLMGVATTLPLIWFGLAAQRVTLTTLGILQYIAPTGQFLIGVLLYHEPFPHERLIGFSFIWVALIIYTVERIITNRKMAQINYARP